MSNQTEFGRAAEVDLLLPTIRTLHNCLKNLYTAHTAKPVESQRTSQQYNLMCEFEIAIHLEFIHSIKEFVNKVEPEKDVLEYFTKIIADYTNMVGNCGIVGFEDIVNGKSNNVTIYQHANSLWQGREALLGIMIGAIWTITNQIK